MGLKETDAWVIHKRPIGDSSYYVTFFTKQKGVIIALFRGAAKSTKKQSILQQFNPLWVNFNEKLDKFYVNHVELQGGGLKFTKDSLFAALYINELLYYLLKPEDDYPCLFDAYVEILTGLQLFSERYSIEILLRSFEIKLLQAIGYGLSLTIDVEKNRQISPELYYQFLPDKGIVSAHNRHLSKPAQVHESSSTEPTQQFAIRFGKLSSCILGQHLLAIDKYNFSDNHVLKSAKIITRLALDYCLADKSLKSRDLYGDFKFSPAVD